MLREQIRSIEQDLSHFVKPTGEQAQQLLPATLVSLRERAQKCLEDFVATNRSEDMTQDLVEETASEDSPRQVARSVVAEVLYASSDVQTLAGQSFRCYYVTCRADQFGSGVALAMVGILRQSELSLYQFHLVYDTINLTRFVCTAFCNNKM